MMNPGSSQPLNSVPAVVGHARLSLTRKKLVSTKPDTTQYQIMRLMHYCDLNYVRVINLSDLREASSASFIKQYRELEDVHNYIEHSIFSPARFAELAKSLERSAGAPIIAAWGASPQLDRLIGRCVPQIKEEGGVVGLPHHEGADRYLHPLPRMQADKRAWVDAMVKRIHELGR